MDQIRYKRILYKLLILVLFSIPVVYYVTCKQSLPDTIQVSTKEEAKFNYNVPAIGEIADKTIKLNQPFVLKKDSIGTYEMKAKLFGAIPLKNIKVNVVNQTELTPSGEIVGIYVETNGLLVLGTDQVTGVDGRDYEPSENKLYKGDYILTVDGKMVGTKTDFIKTVNESKGQKLHLCVKRNEKKVQVVVVPVCDTQDHQYKIGVWIRDNTQGIGTLTYTSNLAFGGLGHGICDMDTGELMKVQGGFILTPMIDAIQKGKSGNPGEIVGSIYYKDANVIGRIQKNTSYGIYGQLESKSAGKPYKVGYKQDVKKGKAQIISSISGKSETYDIKINRVDQSNRRVNKGMEIEITDSRLLKLTNGIVQGMSGTPILQNGKIIGAITHVFVDDSTKGYGTFIENMMNAS